VLRKGNFGELSGDLKRLHCEILQTKGLAMNFMKHASIVSTVALMTIGTAGFASAQDYGQDQKREYGQRSECVAGEPGCPPAMRKKDKDMDEMNVQVDKPRKMSQAESKWRFDSNRHERRRHKDDRFRFFFNGFWYPEPYWLGYGLRPIHRIGCAEGRLIVRDHGFYRVRTVECNGRTYTYLGRRHGDTFRILLNSRSGRVIDFDPV
jgi:hypothetical protein